MNTDWRAKVDEHRLRQQEQRERRSLGWLMDLGCSVAFLAAVVVIAVVCGVWQ